MKKLISTLLTGVMCMSLAATAFAADGSATVTTVPGAPDGIDVYAQYDDSTSTPTVYSVDITWDSMTFVYEETGAKNWDASDHSYTEQTTSAWTYSEAEITVTNHSNAAVDVTLAYTADDTVDSGVTGSLDVTSGTLAAGEVDGYATADTLTSIFTVSGTPNSSVVTAEGVKIGTISITLE
ncbi:MAG: hypothetical protein LUE29_14130 [Lachnospiraceae bacterium]|nr:hypothetical protein [Lachnospiraceae bacterium]